jgi:hypothetical protein
MLFIHPTLLEGKFFLILQLDDVLQVLPVLVSKPGCLVLFSLVLIEGELQLYQRTGGVELVHIPVLVFPMAEAQLRLCG